MWLLRRQDINLETSPAQNYIIALLLKLATMQNTQEAQLMLTTG